MGIKDLPNYDPRFVVAVDYDGTLTDDGFEGNIIPDRVADIVDLQQKGTVIILWTCRCGAVLDEILINLKGHGFVPNYVNEYPLRGESRKVNADYYVDDRNCLGLDWDESMKFLKSEIENGQYEVN